MREHVSAPDKDEAVCTSVCVLERQLSKLCAESGAPKMRDMKIRERKTQHRNAEVENTRHENVAQFSRTAKSENVAFYFHVLHFPPVHF